MNNSIKLAHDLKDEIEKEPLIIEYRRIKNLLDSNEEINSLKKEIAKAKATNNSELHKELLNRYNTHPLVANFNALKEEVSDYLLSISQIVNKK